MKPELELANILFYAFYHFPMFKALVNCSRTPPVNNELIPVLRRKYNLPNGIVMLEPLPMLPDNINLFSDQFA